jgi:hypothetical protein
MDFPIIDLLDEEMSVAWLMKHFYPDGLRCPHCQAEHSQILKATNCFRMRGKKALNPSILTIRPGVAPTSTGDAAHLPMIVRPWWARLDARPDRCACG